MRRRLAIWLLVGSSVAGCATTGTLQGGIYEGDQTTYRVGVVTGDWTPVTVGHQNDLAWHSESRAGVMHVDSSCDPALDIPLSALRNHLVIGFTERELLAEDLVPMDGREALRTHMKATLDGVPREIMLQILKKDGCLYDFGLITPPGDGFQEALDDFDQLLAGFTTDVGRS